MDVKGRRRQGEEAPKRGHRASGAADAVGRRGTADAILRVGRPWRGVTERVGGNVALRHELHLRDRNQRWDLG